MSSSFDVLTQSLPPSQNPTLQSPPVLHTPPCIFGSSSTDASAMPIFSDPLFNLDDLALMPEAGFGDPKRRRIARACDMCRKKKIKCDGKLPACTHCINYKTECLFTHVEKKRNPPRGAKYVEGLENRLSRMESLLRRSGLLEDGDDGKTDLATLEKRLARRSAQKGTPSSDRRASTARASSTDCSHYESSAPNSPMASPGTSTSPREQDKRTEEEVEALSDMMCSLVTNNSGETRYIGSSSGFSIFSPKGIQWVNEKTGDTSFQEMISSAAEDDDQWILWKPAVFDDIFARRTFQPLPLKDEAMTLLKTYFDHFNCMFPLFFEPSFMRMVDLHYSAKPFKGSGWWASFNVALAISHRIRVMSNLVPQEEDQKAWGYLKNAMGVLTELTMRNTDLFSVQALLGMSLFLQGTPNPQPSFFLVAAATRLAHSIGLHKRGSGFNLSPEEIEQRKRVFWIAYMLDKDLCLRSGRPPLTDDYDVELPSEDPPDNIGNIPLSDGKGKMNLYRKMCEFSIIEDKVYRQLYSTKASRQSDGELLNTIGELDKELDQWKDSIPIDFRPEHEIKASHAPMLLHITTLHFAYYNCLTTIHRMSIQHGYLSRRKHHVNPQGFSSAKRCVCAARATVKLLQYIPQGDFACVWLVLYFPVSALVTLFANLLQNPQDVGARSDLQLMNRVVSFLSMLCNEEENNGVKRMLSVCATFERIAQVVLDKADHEAASRRKRKSHHHVEAKKKALERAAASSTTSPLQNGASAPSFKNENTTLAPPPPSAHSSISPSSDGSWSTTEMASTNGINIPNLPIPPSASSDPGYPDVQTGSYAFNTPLNLHAFQQPFLPQDLWQMPMTWEWDWADMTALDGGGLFEPVGGPLQG